MPPGTGGQFTTRPQNRVALYSTTNRKSYGITRSCRLRELRFERRNQTTCSVPRRSARTSPHRHAPRTFSVLRAGRRPLVGAHSPPGQLHRGGPILSALRRSLRGRFHTATNAMGRASRLRRLVSSPPRCPDGVRYPADRPDRISRSGELRVL